MIYTLAQKFCSSTSWVAQAKLYSLSSGCSSDTHMHSNLLTFPQARPCTMHSTLDHVVPAVRTRPSSGGWKGDHGRDAFPAFPEVQSHL